MTNQNCTSFIEIPLSRGMVALIDAADAELVLPFKWCAQRGTSTFYAVRRCRRPDGRPDMQRLHSTITGFAIVDHRNGDGLDNRRCNLREATKRQNNMNRRAQVGTSQFKGVAWYKRDGCWRANIGISGRVAHLGYFTDEQAAARAYDAAARLHFGEFATLNFPHPGERSALEVVL